MTASAGRFVWYELITHDVASAARFYEPVIGWASRDGGFPGQDYTLFSAGGAAVAGALKLPPQLLERGVTPHWTGYVGVDKLRAMLARVRAAGGVVHHGPEAVPGVGSLAVVGDPQGAVFSLLQPEPGMSGPQRAPGGTPDHVGWTELAAAETESAFAFYAGMFGWTKGQAVDMGPMGTYQTFHIGDVWAGGIMTKPESIPRPAWLYYFNVDSAAAAASRIGAAGGSVINRPHQVPGGGWIVQARDPQGAMFAVVGPK